MEKRSEYQLGGMEGEESSSREESITGIGIAVLEERGEGSVAEDIACQEIDGLDCREADADLRATMMPC